ncbi:MAG: CotH kinase family protein [Acidobacteriota bacterium]
MKSNQTDTIALRRRGASHRRATWITIAGVLAALPLAALAQRGGFGGPPMGQERKILAQFDKDGNKRLDATERKAAREWLATQPAVGFGGRGGFGRGGNATPATPGRHLTPADVKSYPGAPLYDAGTLRTIFLQFEAPDWEQELAAFNNTDVEVPAAATVDGQAYKDVGVHFRGMSSYFMVPEGKKRSLNVSFDFVHDAQQLGGYRTLNLLNSNGDPTFLRGMLYTHIASQYIPVPKMNFMRVVINGESWGVYLNAQQFNKDFTRDFFKSTSGARWKVPGSPGGRGGLAYLGENVEDYKKIYQITSKDSPQPWADFIKLCKVLNDTPADQLEAALAPVLDVDGVLKFLALDVALDNSDGFWTRASDYSIYQDPKGIFHILPHDLNEGLGAEEGGPGGPGGRRGGGPPPDFAGGPFPGGGQPPDMGRGGPPPEMGRGGPGQGPGQGRGGFGGRGRGGVELDPLVGLTDDAKALRSKLLAVPAFRAKYLADVHDIAEKWLDWKTLGPVAQKYHDLIAADVAVDTRKIYGTEEFDSGLNGALKTFVEKRRAFLLK